MGKSATTVRAALLSIVLLAGFLGAWWLATRPAAKPATSAATTAAASGAGDDYAALMGDAPNSEAKVSGVPGPAAVGKALYAGLHHPFYDNGPNDKGLGLQLMYSLGRVLLGYGLAVVVAIPLGFLIGMSPLFSRALDPFIQILKPISPLAWMPLALYTIKDSGRSAIFVIFICSLWPMLLNTAFGVGHVRKEWLNVGRTLQVRGLRRAFTLILPASLPTILTGMRISIGIAWLVIVAAEMLVGGTGIGYFVWNQWNNLNLANVIVAVLLIGVTGMALDQLLAAATRAATFQE